MEVILKSSFLIGQLNWQILELQTLAVLVAGFLSTSKISKKQRQ